MGSNVVQSWIGMWIKNDEIMCTDKSLITQQYSIKKIRIIHFDFTLSLTNKLLKQGFSYVGVSEMMTGSNWNKQSHHWAQTSILQSLLLTTHKTLVSSGLVSCGWKFDVSCCFTLAYCTKQPQQSQHTTACKWKISTGDRHITITKCVSG